VFGGPQWRSGRPGGFPKFAARPKVLTVGDVRKGSRRTFLVLSVEEYLGDISSQELFRSQMDGAAGRSRRTSSSAWVEVSERT